MITIFKSDVAPAVSSVQLPIGLEELPLGRDGSGAVESHAVCARQVDSVMKFNFVSHQHGRSVVRRRLAIRVAVRHHLQPHFAR